MIMYDGLNNQPTNMDSNNLNMALDNFTMKNLARAVQMKFLQDCLVDFYRPTMLLWDLVQSLKNNMLDGRQDALFMLTPDQKRLLVAGDDVRTNAFHHKGTGTVVRVEISWTVCENTGTYHWFCAAMTDDQELGIQEVLDCGLDEEDYDGDPTMIHHFVVDTGVRPNLPYTHDHSHDEILVTRARQFTPNGLNTCWTRAFPGIQRQIRKLRRCKTCKKQFQTNPRCAMCVMA